MSAYDVMDNLLRTSLVTEAADRPNDLETELALLDEGDEALLGLWYTVTGRSLVFCEDEEFEQWLSEEEEEEERPLRPAEFRASLRTAAGLGPEPDPDPASQEPVFHRPSDDPKSAHFVPLKRRGTYTRGAKVPGPPIGPKRKPQTVIAFPRLTKKGAERLVKKRVLPRPAKAKPEVERQPTTRALAPERASDLELHQALHTIAGIKKPHDLKPHEHEAIEKFWDAYARQLGHQTHVTPDVRRREQASKDAFVKRALDKAGERKEPLSDEEKEAVKRKAAEEWHGSRLRAVLSAPARRQTPQQMSYEAGRIGAFTGTSGAREPYAGIRNLAASYVEKHPDPDEAPEDVHRHIQNVIHRRGKYVEGQARADAAKRERAGTKVKLQSELTKGQEGEPEFELGQAEHARVTQERHPMDRMGHLEVSHEFHGKDHPRDIASVFRHRFDMQDAAERVFHHHGRHSQLRADSAATNQKRKESREHLRQVRDRYNQIVASKGRHPVSVRHAALANLHQARNEHEAARNEHHRLAREARINSAMLQAERDRFKHAQNQHEYFHGKAMARLGMPHGIAQPYDERDFKLYGAKMDLALKALGRHELSPEEAEKKATKEAAAGKKKGEKEAARRRASEEGEKEALESISLYDVIIEAKQRKGEQKEEPEMYPALLAAKRAELEREHTPAHRARRGLTGLDPRVGEGLTDKDWNEVLDKWAPETKGAMRTAFKEKLLLSPADVDQLLQGLRGQEPGTIPPSERAAFRVAAERKIRPGGKGGALGPRKQIADVKAERALAAEKTAADVEKERKRLRAIWGQQMKPTDPKMAQAIKAAHERGAKAGEAERQWARVFVVGTKRGAAAYKAQLGQEEPVLPYGEDPGSKSKPFAKPKAEQKPKKKEKAPRGKPTEAGGEPSVQSDSESLYGTIFCEASTHRGRSLFEAILA